MTEKQPLDFIRQIMRFYRTGDNELLRPFLPDEVFQQVSLGGPLFEEMQQIFQFLLEENNLRDVKDVPELDLAQVEMQLTKMPQISMKEKKRALLLLQFHQLLAQKYELNVREIRSISDFHHLLKDKENGKLGFNLNAAASIYYPELKGITIVDDFEDGAWNI